MISSPATAMGTAGGHPTVGMPQIRPKDSAAGISSWAENNACRMEHTRRPFASGRKDEFAGGRWFFPSAFCTRASSSGVFSGVTISTRKSSSAYSHSIFSRRSCSARKVPSKPWGARTVSRSGSPGSTCQPASLSWKP